MARYNEILVGRFNRFLQKFLSMKGGPPAPQLASEITTALPIFTGLEDHYLQGMDEFAGMAVQAASPGNTSSIRIRNPVASNVVAVLTSIKIAMGSNDTIVHRIGSQAADYATVPLLFNAVDSRPRPKPIVVLSTVAPPVAFGTQIGQYNLLANTVLELCNFEDHVWPLFPGVAYQFDTSVVNQALVVNLRWRERLLEESERV